MIRYRLTQTTLNSCCRGLILGVLPLVDPPGFGSFWRELSLAKELNTVLFCSVASFELGDYGCFKEGRSVNRKTVMVLGGLCCAQIGLANAGLFDGAVYSGSGYLRENLALGFEDHPERSAATGKSFGGKGDLLMVRHSILLEGFADFGWANFGAVTRFSREEMTS